MLTLEGLNIEHKTCCTICGTPVEAILDLIFLTELAVWFMAGQNMAKNAPGTAKPIQNCWLRSQGPLKWTQINQGYLVVPLKGSFSVD